MIGRLRGIIVEKRPTALLLDVGGVGYETAIPVSTFDHLPAVGDEVIVVTHTHVREDALLIFAFVSAGERDLFRQLIAVSGVGPKLALAVLSGLSVRQFQGAVLAGDAQRLQAIPGIGKRTAERLVVELRDKLGVVAGVRVDAATPEWAPQLFGDAVSALTALGYSDAGARGAVQKALAAVGDDASLERLVKTSLAAAQR